MREVNIIQVVHVDLVFFLKDLEIKIVCPYAIKVASQNGAGFIGH